MTTYMPEKLLSNCFFEFYELIANCKKTLHSDDPQSVLPEKLRQEGDGDVDYNQLAAFLSRKIELFLANKTKEVESLCTSFEIKMFRHARYVMAALADEIFILEFEWKGSEYWPRYLLEKRLFGSDTSGTGFFVKLDSLLADRSGHVLIKDLAVVFLMSLRLGFCGRYRGTSKKKFLNEYKRKLLTFIGESVGSGERLFRKAYEFTVSELESLRLAPFHPTAKWALIALALYLGVAAYVWYGSLADLWAAMQEMDN